MSRRQIEEVPGIAVILAAEMLDLIRAEQYVSWAQDALASGLDTPSILSLAIEEPPYFTPDLQKLFAKIVRELNVEQITRDQAMVLHAQTVARMITSGSFTPREGAQALAELFPSHVAPRVLSEWWRLDEAYDCDYCRMGVLERYSTIEEAILDEARRLELADWRAA